MQLNLNILVAGAACLALLIWWIAFRKSGQRGFLLALTGCLIIAGATLASQGVWRLVDLASIVLTSCFVLALVLVVFLLIRARRRRPRYHAPSQMLGSCSNCGKHGQLKQSKRGWLCPRCSQRYGVAA